MEKLSMEIFWNEIIQFKLYIYNIIKVNIKIYLTF